MKNIGAFSKLALALNLLAILSYASFAAHSKYFVMIQTGATSVAASTTATSSAATAANNNSTDQTQPKGSTDKKGGKRATNTSTSTAAIQNSCKFLLQKYPGKNLWESLHLRKETFPSWKHDPIIILPDKKRKNRRTAFAFCTVPKNGCSRWRRFFRKVEGVPNYLEEPHNTMTNGLKYPADIDAKRLFQRRDRHQWWLSNRDGSKTTRRTNATTGSNEFALLRVAMVRDPLSRALSAWTNKVESGEMTSDVVCPRSKLNPAKSFSNFIQCLYDHKQQQKQKGSNNVPCLWNEHWRPQLCHCHLNQMKYDLLLPVEQKDSWFQPLMDCLQLTPWTKNYTRGGDAFGSHKADAKGSRTTGTGSLDVLCEVYRNSTLYSMTRYIYETDLSFSSWNWKDDCKGKQFH